MREKNIITRFFDELLIVLSKIIDNLLNMKAKQLIRFIIELILITIVILILKTPFDIIKELGKAGIIFLFFPISKMFSLIWTIILESTYLLFAITLFIYIFNKKYTNHKLTKSKKGEYQKAFTELYKALIITVSFPLYLALIILILLLMLAIYLLSQGITYISIIPIIVSLLALDIIAIYIVTKYIKNNKKKKVLVRRITIVSILILAMGLTLLTFEILDTKFQKGVLPLNDYNVKAETLRTSIDGKTKIICNGCHNKYELLYDNKLNSEIIIEISYYDQFVQSMFSTDKNLIVINSRKLNIFNPDMQEYLIENLRKKEIYDYKLLHKKQMTIWVNENDVSNLEIKVN